MLNIEEFNLFFKENEKKFYKKIILNTPIFLNNHSIPIFHSQI